MTLPVDTGASSLASHRDSHEPIPWPKLSRADCAVTVVGPRGG